MRRPSWRVVGFSAGALVALERLLRRIEPELATRPLVWHDRIAEHKAFQMRERRSRGQTAGDLVIGNSMALVGLDPSVLSDATYNGALHRGVPTVTERWFREELLPTLRPARVLYGVSVLDFNDRGEFHAKITRRYDDAPRTGRGPVRATYSLVLRHLALARLAPLLLQPRVLAGAVLRAAGRRDPVVSRVTHLVDGQGWGREHVGVEGYRHTDNQQGWLTTSILVDYAYGGTQTAAFERTLALLQREGITAEAVLLPVTSDFVRALPGGDATYADVVAHVRAVCERHHVRFLDVGDPFAGETDPWFADSFHLSATGARRFSELVAEARAEPVTTSAPVDAAHAR